MDLAAQSASGSTKRGPPKRLRSLTRQGKRPAAPDFVRRTFTAVAADVLWVVVYA
ncbi:hypothetical protein [Nonomuraea deserti]|uniref:hypothetical protein n=1 Tax=Nonomuraea deserti TaxID=1848322 RepID=UPI001FEC6795|nr:hypothetical protein [Nonomuraea deserti]